MERLLLLGAEGQVGQEVQKRIPEGIQCACPTLSELDITNAELLAAYFASFNPEVVVNCAAYTAVDKAEDEPELARAINATAAGEVARLCSKHSSALVQVSTDYVFGKGHGEPIAPEAAADPLSVYGATKLEGEALCREILAEDQLTIVRTSSVHGALGHNFVHTMLKLFREREELKVVADQYMSPSWAGWLSSLLLSAAASVSNTPAVIHASCSGVITWYDFTSEILRLVEGRLEGVTPKLTPIPASEFPVKATRPPYSALDCSFIETSAEFPERISWKDGLAAHLTELGEIDS